MNITKENCEAKRKVKLRGGQSAILESFNPSMVYPVFGRIINGGSFLWRATGELLDVAYPNGELDIVAFADEPREVIKENRLEGEIEPGEWVEATPEVKPEEITIDLNNEIDNPCAFPRSKSPFDGNGLHEYRGMKLFDYMAGCYISGIYKHYQEGNVYEDVAQSMDFALAYLKERKRRMLK